MSSGYTKEFYLGTHRRLLLSLDAELNLAWSLRRTDRGSLAFAAALGPFSVCFIDLTKGF